MKLTDKQIARILEDMIILTDTREKKNEHILCWLDESYFKREMCKLNSGDYTCKFPHYPQYDGLIVVEKKNSLTEICGNFTSKRKQFGDEFNRMPVEVNSHIVIEEATWKKVSNGSYRSEMHPNSMWASLLTWNARYGCPIWFVGKGESAELIYKLIYYGIMEKLKNIT